MQACRVAACNSPRLQACSSLKLPTQLAPMPPALPHSPLPAPRCATICRSPWHLALTASRVSSVERVDSPRSQSSCTCRCAGACRTCGRIGPPPLGWSPLQEVCFTRHACFVEQCLLRLISCACRALVHREILTTRIPSRPWPASSRRPLRWTGSLLRFTTARWGYLRSCGRLSAFASCQHAPTVPQVTHLHSYHPAHARHAQSLLVRRLTCCG